MATSSARRRASRSILPELDVDVDELAVEVEGAGSTAEDPLPTPGSDDASEAFPPAVTARSLGLKERKGTAWKEACKVTAGPGGRGAQGGCLLRGGKSLDDDDDDDGGAEEAAKGLRARAVKGPDGEAA